MPDERPSELTAKIVAAYVRRNQITADQLNTLISSVYQTLVDLGKPSAEIEAPRAPAVPIRRSVHRDYVVCLDCGWRGQMLRRHIAAAHGLGVEEYRARWMLPADHPLTALAYSERRSTMAKQFGLGHGRQMSAADMPLPEIAPVAKPVPRRRARPRSAAPGTSTPASSEDADGQPE
jgi:MucR family transcriptional regulator, transcriptional regulator of exopolysaccharide biosynthesis